MCAMRRQLSGVVKYCLPSSCWPAATSHRRNSAFSLPSPWRVMRPVTSASALIARQSGNFGTLSLLVIFSMNAAGLIGANRPLRWRLLVITAVTFRPLSPSARPPVRRPAGQEARQGSRLEPHVALVDVDVENGPRRTRAGSRQRPGANQHTATAYFGERSIVSHEIALPCGKIVKHLLCVESEVYF